MPRKQSTSRLSTLAASVMSATKRPLYSPNDYVWIQVRDLRTLAASVLSQDEIRGQKKKRKATSKYNRRGPNNSD